MSPRPPDLDRLFTDGGEHGLSSGHTATVRIVAGPDLRLPSGRLVACEPGTRFPEGARRATFVQRVEPGAYPVELAVADVAGLGPRGAGLPYIAAARLAVRREPVAAWRPALLEGQDEADLDDGAYYGYPVDAGVGAFGSTEVFDSLSGPGADDDTAEDVWDLTHDLEDHDRAGAYTDPVTGANVVFFCTGEGDGHYGTWVGYTAGGAVACFVTVFMFVSGAGGPGGEGEEDRARDRGPLGPAPAP
ncbi:DUF4241 domain-containing protein [Nocardiopsis mangrovi]|uniref:DUF4241 domain-containing protein n=1 Tax=Nocardiopsis mangrovi TaxID=1179818 RepID=A0ABV9DV68_9ACTN